ncbi:aldehyde dehydrogenase family protein [Vibrio cholerae]
MKKHIPFIINGRVTDCSKKSESEQKSIFFRENSLNVDVLTDHISDEITSYKNSLELTLNNIVNFLYTVGQRWKNEEYTRRRSYIRDLKNFLGYSEEMAKLEANWIAMILCSKSALYDIVQTELGSRHILDEWIAQDECYVKALPKGRTLHLLAGNVPLSGVTSILRAILTKNQIIVKMSSNDPFTPHALAMSFIDVDPNHPITQSISIIYWPHTQCTQVAQRLMQKMDVVVAWGGSEAIRWAVEHTPPHAELIKFGPKKSLTIINDPENLIEAAEGAAHDICFYDQQACFSTQNLFYIGSRFPEFKQALREQLQRYARILPKSQSSIDEQADFSLTLRECQFAGFTAEMGNQQDWMMIESPAGVELNHPLGRCIYLHQMASFEEVLPFVIKGQTQTVSLFPWSCSLQYRDQLAAHGAERIVESGMNNIFRVGGAHDAMRPLQRLVRFISHERPSRFTTKDVAVAIEQTRYLEEDKFLVFVP